MRDGADVRRSVPPATWRVAAPAALFARGGSGPCLMATRDMARSCTGFCDSAQFDPTEALARDVVRHVERCDDRCRRDELALELIARVLAPRTRDKSWFA